MKQIIVLLLFILLTSIGFSQSFWPCIFQSGKLGVQKVDNIYKVFIKQEPINNCFIPDSTITVVTIYCKATNTTVTKKIEIGDTLTFKLGMVIISGSTKWYYGNNWYQSSFSPICIFGTHQCIEEVIDTPLPPIIVPIYTIENGLVQFNLPGTIIVLYYPSYVLKETKTFNNSFGYQLDVGEYYVFIQMIDGTTLDLGVIIVT